MGRNGAGVSETRLSQPDTGAATPQRPGSWRSDSSASPRSAGNAAPGAASRSYRLAALPVAREAAWEMQSGTRDSPAPARPGAGSPTQFLCGRFFPNPGPGRASERRDASALPFNPREETEMFGLRQCLPPGSDPKQGLLRRGWEPWSAKGDAGTARTGRAREIEGPNMAAGLP